MKLRCTTASAGFAAVLILATAFAADETSTNDAVPEKRTVVLVVQNHAAPGAKISMMALTDALTAKLSGRGLQVVNPYNSIGRDLNRTAAGEKMPLASVIDVARKLKANGAVTASVIEFLDSTVGTPVLTHQYSVRLVLNLSDAWTGGTVIEGVTVVKSSPQYTSKQVAANRQKYLGDLMYAAAEEAAGKLVADPEVKKWRPKPPPREKPPLPPVDPNLTISDIDGAVQRLFSDMRLNPVFRTNYDSAQKDIGKAPLAIIGGVVDLTDGKSPTGDVSGLLAAAGQSIRMAFVNSGLFEAKNDDLAGTVTKRIIANGNSPLEDGELMSALKQHGSPDFFVVGDLRYFVDAKKGKYRFSLALHNLHTGKIVWEGVHTVEK